MFPEGIITREVKVGPAFDLQSGLPYTIRVMISPTRSLIWGATGDPVIAKLKTYVIEAGKTGYIELPTTDQSGYETGKGQLVTLEPGQHAFGYTITSFFMIGGSVAKTHPKNTFTLPSGTGPVGLEDLVSFNEGNAGGVISFPDQWSAQIAAAEEAALQAAASAAAAQDAIDLLEADYVRYESDLPVQRLFFRVDPDTEDVSLVIITP